MVKKNIGVLGCSKVGDASLFKAIKWVEGFEVYAVASRDLGRAQAYAEKYGVKNYYGSYEQLIDDDKVDCVYIATTNDSHGALAIRAAKAGKHIVVEKPICLSMENMSNIQEACMQHNVHLLEGIMVQHHPWQAYIKQMIENNTYGALRSVKTQISFQLDASSDNYRCKKALGGGAFWDEGPYWIQFIQYILGLQPKTYNGYSDFSGPDGCDWTFQASMAYKGGIHVDFTTSFEMPYEATHWLVFDKATVRISNFFRASMGNFKINIDIEALETGVKEKLSFEPQNYYVNQLDFFSHVLGGTMPNISLNQSTDRIRIMENIYMDAKKNNKDKKEAKKM